MDVHSSPVPQPLPPGRQRLLRWILIGGVGIVAAVMVGGGELAFRYYERHRSTPPDYFPSIFYPRRHVRYGLIPNLDYYRWFTINSHGFRGREVSPEKKPGMIRIVCLGGSTTFDTGSIGKDLPWPEVLEKTLRQQMGSSAVEVLNLGIPGTTSLDSLIDLQTRAIEFQPDLVIVYQGHNDLIYSVLSARPNDPDLFPDEDTPRGRLVRWLTMNSLLYAKREARVATLINRMKELLTFDSTVRAASTEERTHAVERGLAAYTANMKSIAAIARAHGIALALPAIIVPFPDGNHASGRCIACEALSVAYWGLPLEEIRRTTARYNAVLEQVGTEDGVHYIATDGWVPSADRFYHESVHFAPEGSMRMGEKMAEALTPILRTVTHQ
jgi:lysophospholipase L1-like esterase